jgi:hypothetical protein
MLNSFMFMCILDVGNNILGVYQMSLEEKLLKNFLAYPEEKKQEVIDFVEFLKGKNEKKLDSMMDDIIEHNREALEELSK